MALCRNEMTDKIDEGRPNSIGKGQSWSPMEG
jgi:hypothetical protein